jgi:hypothetical protein
MITFNRVCKELGLEPKAVRMILKSCQPYKIKIIPNNSNDRDKVKIIKNVLNWWIKTQIKTRKTGER